MKIFIEASVLLLAYIFGSIPFGLLIVKLTTGKDIRHVASGRTGGTNAARAAGVGAGLLTALMDALKGAAAVWVALAVSPNNHWLHVLAPIAGILGHNYSIFLAERDSSGRLRLRGGAGGGPTVGGAFGLWWTSVLIVVPLAALVFIGIGYASITTISIALIITAIFAVRYGMGLATLPDVAYGLMALLLLVWALRPNITALIEGRERFHGWRPWQKRGPEALATKEFPRNITSRGTPARKVRGSVKTSGKKTPAKKAAASKS
jgi:glycerol-3-phosphate acyltransferase PlsY